MTGVEGDEENEDDEDEDGEWCFNNRAAMLGQGKHKGQGQGKGKGSARKKTAAAAAGRADPAHSAYGHHNRWVRPVSHAMAQCCAIY